MPGCHLYAPLMKLGETSLLDSRYHTVDGVLSCKPISDMFSVVYCSVNPVYVILQSIGSKGAEVDPC